MSKEIKNEELADEKKSKFRLNSKTIAIMAMLIAMQVVLARFLSFSTWNTRIGFGFVPIALAAMLFGAVPAAIVASVSDLLGALLFPSGAYFPGFTLTAFLTGMVYGYFLHKRKGGYLNILFAVLIIQFVLGLFMNTYWISLLYGSPFSVLLATRVIQAAILTVVQTLTVIVVEKASSRLKNIVTV
ncbi:MAG: folate family ECF transporter S component [Lachnospiraceae bacterium]|nr:folate family ECF transporter S component [Lachnospiraceae bacterium]